MYRKRAAILFVLAGLVGMVEIYRGEDCNRDQAGIPYECAGVVSVGRQEEPGSPEEEVDLACGNDLKEEVLVLPSGEQQGNYFICYWNALTPRRKKQVKVILVLVAVCIADYLWKPSPSKDVVDFWKRSKEHQAMLIEQEKMVKKCVIKEQERFTQATCAAEESYMVVKSWFAEIDSLVEGVHAMQRVCDLPKKDPNADMINIVEEILAAICMEKMLCLAKACVAQTVYFAHKAYLSQHFIHQLAWSGSKQKLKPQDGLGK